MKSLFVTYLKDIHALRFQLEKIKQEFSGQDFSLLFREDNLPESKYFTRDRVLYFPKKGEGALAHLASIFDLDSIKNLKKEGFVRLYLFMHSKFGFLALALVFFAVILNIPEVVIISLRGEKVILKRKKILPYFFKQQFTKALPDYLLSKISLKLKLPFSLGMPVYLNIEPTNICSLKCPICRTGIGKLDRKQGMMDIASFRMIIDKAARHTNTLFLYGSGEPLLNQDIYEMISYAKRKKIFVSLCTNGQKLDFEKVVETGLDEIGFAVGGASQETHEAYRINSDLGVLLNNVSGIVEAKKRLHKNFPAIIIDLVVQKHNEAQLEEIFKKSLDLGADGINFTPTIIWDTQQADKFLSDNPSFNRYDQKWLECGIIKYKNIGRNCCYPWFGLIIQWDGNVSPCCGLELPYPQFNSEKNALELQWQYNRDFYPLGNILKEKNLRGIWNGRKMHKLRALLLKSKNYINICRLCSGYDAPAMN